MTIQIEYETEKQLEIPYEQIVRDIIPAVLEYENCPYEAEVSLLLTMDEQIQKMNTEFRGIERSTDVLSFPMIDYPGPGEFGFLEEREDCFDPESGELSLGDIVISKDRVTAQAQEYGHSVLREYAFLIVHSVLHLTGYDHIEDPQRQEMESVQREIMQRLDILR